jgi:hypothetical protein
LGKNGIFELAKFAKKFGKKFGNLSSEKVCILIKIVRQFQKFQKNYVKFEFLSQKTLFLGQKVWKMLGKVQKSLETGFSKHLEILEIVLFRTFQKF